MNTPVADFVQRYAKAGTARLHARPQGPLLSGLRALGHHGNPRGGRPLRGGGHPGGERAKRRRPVRQPAHLLLHGGVQPVHPGDAVSGGGQRLPYRGGGTKRPPGLCLRRRSAGFDPLAVAGRKAALCAGAPSPPAQLEEALGSLRSLRRRCTSPARTIWAVWRKYRLGPGVPPARHLTAGGQRPWGLSAVFRTIPPPLDLGADLCCDSAHKTLPVLTGGAYLHLSPAAPARLAAMAKSALGLFGSTSPSYLTLASLDLCNRYLAEGVSPAPGGNCRPPGGASGKSWPQRAGRWSPATPCG